MFDQVLKTNLIGDEKELFYLLEFLQIKLDSLDVNALVDSDWISVMKPLCNDFIKLRKAKSNPKPIKRMKSFDGLPKQGEMSEGKDLDEAFGMLEIGDTKPEKNKKEVERRAGTKTAITTSLSRILDTNQKDLDFSLVSLPENFYDSYHGFIYKSCDLCHSRNVKSDLMLCMLCGELLCSHSCNDLKQTVQGRPLSPVGNIFKHSMQVHAGAGVFFYAFNGQYTIYEGSRWYNLSGLFVNTFGVSVNETKRKESDYKEFNLDLDKLNRIKKDILDFSLDAQVVALNIIENLLYRPMFL